MSEFADGPAMQALTEKQRLFVLAHAANPMGKGADWARQAGYSDGKGKNCAVIAVTLLRHPGVVEAMFEVSRLAFRAKGPGALGIIATFIFVIGAVGMASSLIVGVLELAAR